MPLTDASGAPSPIEQTATSIVVRMAIAAPIQAVFAVLVDPRRHVEIDGSGMVRAAAQAEPITAVGQVFTMSMTYPALGDYRTDNHVVEFADGRRIAWRTARAGESPEGAQWTWALDDIDGTHTAVTHTYDWSVVTDPGVLARVSFPRVSAEELLETMRRLAAAAS